MLVAKTLDNVFMQVDSDEEGLLWDLQEKFSFYVPNYMFQPKFKEKLWDGKIRLYSPYKRKLYVGLLPELKKYCARNKIPLHIDPVLESTTPIDHNDVVNFVKDLNIHSNGKPITPYDYQYTGLYFGMKYKRTTLLSPTASGKSLIIYGLARYFQGLNEKKTLIVVPTKSLVEQMYKDFDDYASELDWSSEKNVHRIYEGADKKTKKDIIVSTWQSIYKMGRPYFNQFDAVIVDEAHQLKANSLTGILEKCNTPFKIGMTGTLDDALANELVIQGLLGEKKVLATTKELMDEGQVTNLKANIIKLKYNDKDKKEVRTQHKQYQQEVDYIINHNKRNNFICNMANKLPENTLVLFNKIDHGKILKKMLDKKIESTGKQVHLIYGDIDVKVREEVRKISENNTNVIIVASYGTFSTGINIKNLHNIILASPTKSKIRVLQSIGRVLRLFKTKTKAELYDIVDDFSHRSFTNYAVKHFIKRFSYYTKEKFEYKTINIDI